MSVWDSFQRPTVLRVTQTRGGRTYNVQRIAFAGGMPHLVANAMDHQLLREYGFVSPDREWTAEPWWGDSVDGRYA